VPHSNNLTDFCATHSQQPLYCRQTTSPASQPVKMLVLRTYLLVLRLLARSPLALLRGSATATNCLLPDAHPMCPRWCLEFSGRKLSWRFLR
jgi:hypothetical protein